MADNFFGFDTDLPDLDGKPGGEDGLEIDRMNDETFGNGAVEDDAWEEEHEKLAGSMVRDEEQEYFRSAAENQPHEPYEDELESSLSRLVVDEDDERNGMPIRSVMQSTPQHPQKASLSRLDELYGPSSPPGYLHSEGLMGGHGNIWGSPVTRESNISQQQEGLKTLLKQLQQQPQHLQDPSIVMSGQALSSSLPTMKQLNDLEHLSRPAPPPAAGVGRGQPGPGGEPTPRRAYTVEELEAELRPVPAPKLPDTSQPPPSMLPSVQDLEACLRSGRPPPPLPASLANIQLQQMKNVAPPKQPQMPAPPPVSATHTKESSLPLAAAVTSSATTSKDFHTQATQPRHPGPSMGPFTEPPPPMHGPRPHGPPGNVRQNLFNNRGGGRGNGPRPPFSNRDGGYDNYQGGYGRGDNRNYRGGGDNNGYHNNADNYHNRGGGGDFRGNRGDYRGDYRDNRMDYNHRDYNHRDYNRGGGGGGYRDNRDEYRNYHQQQDDYYRGRGRGRGGYERTRHDSFGYDYDEEEENPNKDPYSGLMSKKEKDWIIKIQLMQLQTDNPYLDDYYYAAWQVKKLAEEQRKKKGLQSQGSGDSESEPKLVLPHLADRLEHRAYKPVQFENSLGRLTAASVHNPRHIIDVAVDRPIDDKDDKARQLRRYKELLLHIENSYNILLEIDDLEKRALILPDGARPPLIEERHTCIKQLFQRLFHETSQAKTFSKVVSVRKGVKLVARIIPLLHLNEASDVVAEMLRHLSQLAKKDWQKEILPSVYTAMSQVINVADLETLVRFADATRQGVPSPDGQSTSTPSVGGAGPVAAALHHSFGASLVWCLVNRGEHVYTNMDPLDMDVEHQRAWRDFVSVVAEALCVLSKDQVAAPRGGGAATFRQVARHFERLVDKRTYISIEDKLAALKTPTASS